MKQTNKLDFYGGPLSSLIPVGIYVSFCVLLFVFFKAFNMEALAVGGFIALFLGGLFCKDYDGYWKSAIKGISSSIDIVVILLLVGMFSQLIKTAQLSSGFVWLANALAINGGFFVAFTFIAVCIVATATGSSIGTMFIAYPIFYPAGLLLGANPAFLAGAILSGGIFGDNLAPISDTTIASASTQHFEDGTPADIGGVVSSRFRYSLISGGITTLIFALFGGINGEFIGGSVDSISNPMTLVMLVPVALMLFTSARTGSIFKGIFVGLSTGTLIGLLFGLFPFSAVFANDFSHNEVTGYLVDGMNAILPTCALVISIFGIMGVLTDAGMLDAISAKILDSKASSTDSGAELICILGTSLTTILFGGVTSASILTFGPIVDKVCGSKGIHPYRRANILDATANSLPSIVPFMSVFVFIGAALTGLSPITVALGSVYGFVLFAVILLSAATGFGRKHYK